MTPLQDLLINQKYKVRINGTMMHEAEGILQVNKKALVKDIVIRKNYRDGDYWKLGFDEFTLLFCLQKIRSVKPIAGGLFIDMDTYTVEITT